MNTVRILICATFALLVAALVHSYTRNTKSKEKSLSDLENEYNKIIMQKKINQARLLYNPVDQGQPYINNPKPVAITPNTPIVVDDIHEQIEPIIPINIPADPLIGSNTENTKITPNIPSVIDPLDPNPAPSREAELSKIARLEAENANLNEKLVEKEAFRTETNIKRAKSEIDRAALIAQALVMARVKLYDIDSGIILMDLVRPQNLSVGQTLGIRRGKAGGIIGRVKIASFEGSKIGYADPLAGSFPQSTNQGPATFDGPIDIKTGDELIVIP